MLDTEKIFSRQGLLVIIAVFVLIVVIVFMMRRRSEVQQAWQELAGAESFHSEVTLTLNLQANEEEELPFKEVVARVAGDSSYNEAGELEMTGELNLEAKGRGNILFADGQVSVLPDDVAFRLDNLPALLNPSGSLVEKWTYTKASLLRANNWGEVRDDLNEIFAELEYVGSESESDRRQLRFQGRVTPEQEEELAQRLRRSVSGSPTLDVLARLLENNDVGELVVVVPRRGGEITVKISFLKPSVDGVVGVDFAQLDLRFSQFNEPVEIVRPEMELTVDPRVFARLFGSGDIIEVEAGTSN